MGKSERERRHRANLDRIDRVQLVCGSADGLRIDHEGTLFERARMLGEEISAHQATELGLVALDRLLLRVEGQDLRHRRDILAFVAAVWNNKPLALATLRGLEQSVGDDMLAVLDAFRYGRLNLVEHVEGGPRRVSRALRDWTGARV